MRFGGKLAIIGGVLVLGAAGGWWYFNPFNRGPVAPRPAVRLPEPLPAGVEIHPIAGKALAADPAPRRPVRAASALPHPPSADEPALATAERALVAPDPTPQQEPALRRVEPPAETQPAAPHTRPAATQPAPEPPGHPALTSDNPAIAAAVAKLDGGQTIEARHELNALLKAGSLSRSDAAEVRSRLSELAGQTIFSRRVVAGDPLVETYAIQAGDRLVNIARKYDVPHEILMDINNIRNAATIRADQKLKMVRGPFHARIEKRDFRLDVYLGELYVRSYPVGLGSDDGTPEGVWRVKDRLENPTYYPSASAVDKRIISPDDPANPLGEHWIGLEGVEGAAVGHEGYGIHGTIEPDSIGKNV